MTDQLSAHSASHAVQFYAHDDELARGVSTYLDEALTSRETAIVVATAAHRRAFEARIGTAAEISAARAHGDLITVDAAEMIDLFLIGRQPDPSGLELVIGGLIRQALSTGRPVRVYGEMPAVLWDRGHVGAALELERLWTDLGQRLLVSSLCGYPAEAVAAPEHAAARREIFDLHTAVTGNPRTAP